MSKFRPSDSLNPKRQHLNTHKQREREECRCRLTQDQLQTCMNLSHLFSIGLSLSELHHSYLTPLLFASVPFIPSFPLTHTHWHTLRALKSVQYIVFSFSCEPRKRLWENAREVPCRTSPMLGVCVWGCVCLRRASHYGWMGRMGLVAHTISQSPTHII